MFRIETFGSEIQQSHLLGFEVCLEVQADMVDLVVFSITLLIDIRTVFDMYGADRLGTKRELIPALAGLDDSLWSEWTGLDDTATPHMVTQGDIGRLLRPFRIRSKTIWPPRRDTGTKSESGYYRSQFKAAWASYCQPTATPSHMSKIRYLSRPCTATCPPHLADRPRRRGLRRARLT